MINFGLPMELIGGAFKIGSLIQKGIVLQTSNETFPRQLEVDIPKPEYVVQKFLKIKINSSTLGTND